jgi:hypothetical protein
VVGAQLELLSVEVPIDIFQCSHDCKSFPSGEIAIFFDFVRRLTVVGYYSFSSVLDLGDYSFNPVITDVSVNDGPVSWLRVSKNMGSTEGLI